MPSRVASTPAQSLLHVQASIVACELCPRLRLYCTAIGDTRRRAYRNQAYWARPVPGFGDPAAEVLILGLAPGAHGANRTGRPFTGDASGDFLYPILHAQGFASQPSAIHRADGMQLRHAYITSVVRCAPPADKPTPEEIRACSVHLAREIHALPNVRIVVCLGQIAWNSYLTHLLQAGLIAKRSTYPFAHGAEYTLPNKVTLLGSYHPSLRNTDTGRLNAGMLHDVFLRANVLRRL